MLATSNIQLCVPLWKPDIKFKQTYRNHPNDFCEWCLVCLNLIYITFFQQLISRNCMKGVNKYYQYMNEKMGAST